jgi:hypothetical protein
MRRPAMLLALVATLSVASVRAATPQMTVDDIFCRAKSGVGFSYWWGGSCWCSSGCSPDYSCGKGYCDCFCDGCCPNCCSHSGSKGADCSGFTYTVWRLANLSQSDVCGPHGPVAATYMNSSSDWTHVSDSARQPGDAVASSTHVMIFEKNTTWGDIWVYEAKGCSYGVVHNAKGVNWGKYAVARRKNVVVGVCTPGQTQTGSCGNCGTRKRTCGNDHQWGAWGNCTGQGVCAAGSKETKPCGLCGVSARTCNAGCQWGDWGGCQGEGPCAPGTPTTQGCGNCGTQAGSCTDQCQWGNWEACLGQGPCAPGAVETAPCGDCGSQSRGCAGDCTWGGWSACGGPDPEGGAVVCSTGLSGFCAEGRVRCIDGWTACKPLIEPTPEVCDGEDNDCNGLPDDGDPVEMGAVPPTFAAELVDFSFPGVLPRGEAVPVWADFRNVGTEAWPKGAVWLSLGDGGVDASRLYVPGTWAAWDTAAVAKQRVEPGEVGRFLFSIRTDSAPGTEVEEEFRLRAPDGVFVACPVASLHLRVKVTGGAFESLAGPTVGGDLGAEAGDSEAELPGSLSVAPEGKDAGCAAGGESAGLHAALLLALLLAGVLVLRGRRGGIRGVLPALVLLVVGVAGCGVLRESGTSVPDVDGVDGGGELVVGGAVVTGVEPAVAGPLGGAVVVVSGTGFLPEAWVSFGEVEALETTVVDEGCIHAVTPPLVAGPYDVWVRQPGTEWGVFLDGLTVKVLEPTFVEAPEYSFPRFVEEDLSAGVVGDFDRDGEGDIVVVADGRLRLLSGKGNGNFVLDPPLPSEGEEQPPRFPDRTYVAHALVAANLDGDGAPDLLVGTGPGEPLGLLYNGGDGRFIEVSGTLPPESAFDARGAVAADFDGDGLLDLVVANGSGAPGKEGQHRYYRNSPEAPGTFVVAPEGALPSAEESGTGVVAGDVDGDGDADLVVGASMAAGGQHATLYINDGGLFVPAPAGAMPPVATPVRSLVLADLDDDGALDLYLATDGQDVLMRNDGFGYYFNDTAASLPVDKAAGRFVAVADVNLDGILDLLLAHHGQQNRLYLNDGGGRFLDHTPLLPMHLDATRMCLLMDADSNGAPDALFLNGPGEASRLLLSVQKQESP